MSSKRSERQKQPITGLVIPDCQIRPGVPMEHLTWVGNYIEAKRPTFIANLGDFTDMVSLNRYIVGKASAEGNRYKDDVQASKEANQRLTKPWRNKRGYKPRQVMLLGNHENRINVEAECNPRFAGTLSVADLQYERFGWEVHPFLEIVDIERIKFSHYFTSGSKGLAVSSARALLGVTHSSAIMGHVQDRDIAIHKQTQHVGMFAGLCTAHDEDYLGLQGNGQRRGIWLLNEIHDGTFDPMFVSLGFLARRYS